MCGTFIISKVPADVARWFGTTCTIITTTPVFGVQFWLSLNLGAGSYVLW